MPLRTALTPTALLATPLARAAQAADTACQVLLPNDVPVEGRKSPLDSLTFTVAKQPVKLCYGRPSSRGRMGDHREPIDQAMGRQASLLSAGQPARPRTPSTRRSTSSVVV